MVGNIAEIAFHDILNAAPSISTNKICLIGVLFRIDGPSAAEKCLTHKSIIINVINKPNCEVIRAVIAKSELRRIFD